MQWVLKLIVPFFEILEDKNTEKTVDDWNQSLWRFRKKLKGFLFQQIGTNVVY